MDLFKAQLTERIVRTPTIESFRFRAQDKVKFRPGQFLQVLFNGENLQDRTLNKYLSFSSSPEREYFEVTKRLSSSAFSEKLKSLRAGDEVLFKGPMGNVFYQEEQKKIGFLIGGIGITPVISILEYIVDRGLETDAELYYSNRTEDEIAFRAEIDGWKKVNSRISVCYSVTECEPQDKACIRHGYIDKALVCESVPDMKDRVFFIYGPPAMVEAMKKICLETGCHKENVKTETFIGY